MRRLLNVSVLALAACMAMVPARAQLPTLGDGGEMSSASEKKLGEKIARELYRDPDYIDDPVLVEYVQGIWQQLLAAARARGDLSAELDERFAWQVLLGKDRSFNAFALPGGWLGLHLGLVGQTQSRDELASVLAHELSHVTQRHISRLISQQSKQAPIMLAGMILGAIAGARNAEVANAVIAGSQALALQTQLNFSRDMEREADRIGVGVMTQAGFDPQGSVTVFEKMQQASRLSDNGSFPYLRTHPLSTERIAEMQARLQLNERPAQPPALSLDHALIAARSRVISNPGVDAQRGYLSEAQAAPAQLPAVRSAAIYYAAVFSASRIRDVQAIDKWLPRLKQSVQSDAKAARLVRLLEAEVRLAAGDAARAASLSALRAVDRPDVLLAAQAQVKTGHAGEVASRLQTWVSTHPKDAPAWQLLAQAYEAQGQQLRAVRAQAEAQVALLDYSAALDRFKAAQDIARRGTADHIEASIVDTRARQMESLLREQALER